MKLSFYATSPDVTQYCTDTASVYADVSADSSLVYRDDNSDNQAVAHFKYYTGEQAFDRSKITKSTSIDVNVTRNTSDASKVLFDQTAVITVTYHYDTVLSYPDYVKTTTLTTNTFEAEEREEDVSGTKQTVYYVSGKPSKFACPDQKTGVAFHTLRIAKRGPVLQMNLQRDFNG